VAWTCVHQSVQRTGIWNASHEQQVIVQIPFYMSVNIVFVQQVDEKSSRMTEC